MSNTTLSIVEVDQIVEAQFPQWFKENVGILCYVTVII